MDVAQFLPTRGRVGAEIGFVVSKMPQMVRRSSNVLYIGEAGFPECDNWGGPCRTQSCNEWLTQSFELAERQTPSSLWLRLTKTWCSRQSVASLT